MSKRLTFVCILVLVLGTVVDANAASTLKVTCTGELTNTRKDGVTLGNCDLNFISVKQMDEIESVCGSPGTVDTPAENQCRIKAVVSTDPISAADKRKLYKVLELWSVDKGKTRQWGAVKQLAQVDMQYDAVGLAIGPMSETASDVDEALQANNSSPSILCPLSSSIETFANPVSYI